MKVVRRSKDPNPRAGARDWSRDVWQEKDEISDIGVPKMGL